MRTQTSEITNGETTVRISRPIKTAQGAIIRTKVYAEWFVSPDEWPNSSKAKHIISSLEFVAGAEPDLDWHLETRGTDKPWGRAQC